MTTTAPQPTNEELEHKLDEIKTALNIRTTTTSVLDDIVRKLDHMECNSRRSMYLVPLTIGLSIAFAGLSLFAHGWELSQYLLWGCIYYGVATAFVVFALLRMMRMRRKTDGTKKQR